MTVLIFDKQTGEITYERKTEIPFRTAFNHCSQGFELNSGQSEIDERGYIELQELYLRTLRGEEERFVAVYDDDSDQSLSSRHETFLFDKAERYDEPLDAIVALNTAVEASIEVASAEELPTVAESGAAPSLASDASAAVDNSSADAEK